MQKERRWKDNLVKEAEFNLVFKLLWQTKTEKQSKSENQCVIEQCPSNKIVQKSGSYE